MLRVRALVLSCVLLSACGSPDPGSDGGPPLDAGTADASSACAPDTCDHGGTCVESATGPVCTCAAGFEGTRCETEIDECADEPCENAGVCTDGVGRFTCACPVGFGGARCEIDVDDCATTPCQNGGTCTDGVASFRCDCAPGYTGTVCAEDVDECASAPCENGGACTNEIGSFACACAAGFEGDRCETDIDECAAMPCRNDGECTDGIASFTCACAEGFDGDHCQCAVGAPSNVDFTNRGSFTAASIDDPIGAHVTGSGTINVLNLNGLGVVGGANDTVVDGTEHLDFAVDAPDRIAGYFVTSAGNLDGDGRVGAAFVEAFDGAGASLGVRSVDGSGPFDLESLYGSTARIARFRVTADHDAFRVGLLRIRSVTCE